MLLETISADDLDDYVDRSDSYIIDLREPEEYRRAHIQGAINIPYYELDRLYEYPPRKEYVLYCSRGGTSLMAARELGKAGYYAKSVVGGIHMYRGAYLVRDYQ